ncbi:MAG: CRISPR system precrRNA processing endoribonuclease RAMP protein Cas6, partial [Gloeomargarita sp. SKYG116]|nr:CRISPR system precrRNA processing endoribonuclease RAMP protein Cas6 [Gloeomargarita sp. SKYG116]MDW8402355.1 CRISPR system precrRNA processing endoribonuclease RAMP protein Cas6 [Gloeomargarita sp. SKYGB_i_bin116]
TALHAIVFELLATEKGELPAYCGRAIHAQVLRWIYLGNPQVAQAVHDGPESPISVSDLLTKKRDGRVVRSGDVCFFRLGILDADILEPLMLGLERWERQILHLSNFPFILSQVCMLPGSNSWVGLSDYDFLAKMAQPVESLQFRLVSPTSFKMHDGQDIQPFPLPALVFGNLQRRWNAFAPEHLKIPKVEWQVLVSDFDLKTRRIYIDKVAEIGTVGRVRYVFPDAEQGRLANQLAHFAFFAGVGRKTALGMGQVILES